MSVPQFKPIKVNPEEGVIFGQCDAIRGEKLTLYKPNENSQAICLLIHTFHEDRVLRFKPSQLRVLKAIIDKGVECEIDIHTQQEGEKDDVPTR